MTQRRQWKNRDAKGRAQFGAKGQSEVETYLVIENSLMRVVLALVSLVFSFSVAQADGNQLLSSCIKAEAAIDGDRFTYNHVDGYDVGYCVAAVGTYRERLKYIHRLDPPGYKSDRPKSCPIPDEVSDVQLVRILVKWLRDHPENLHIWEAAHLEAAFVSAFPCD